MCELISGFHCSDIPLVDKIRSTARPLMQGNYAKYARKPQGQNQNSDSHVWRIYDLVFVQPEPYVALFTSLGAPIRGEAPELNTSSIRFGLTIHL